MNHKGILRKTSPIKKRNASTHFVNDGHTSNNIRQIIDHNHANGVGDSFDGFESGTNTASKKYQFSTINTTQNMQNRLQRLKNLTVNDATLAELSPRSKGFVAEKVRNARDFSLFVHSNHSKCFGQADVNLFWIAT